MFNKKEPKIILVDNSEIILKQLRKQHYDNIYIILSCVFIGGLIYTAKNRKN
jgi:hypothetical protein